MRGGEGKNEGEGVSVETGKEGTELLLKTAPRTVSDEEIPTSSHASSALPSRAQVT